jgi:hypothetical protein
MGSKVLNLCEFSIISSKIKTKIFPQNLIKSWDVTIFFLWTMLVFLKRVGLKRFEWCWKREKDLCKKVVEKGACLDCGLDLFMSCLMYF